MARGSSCLSKDHRIPNGSKDDSNRQENQSSHKNMTVVMLLGLAQLPLTVIGITFLSGSTHRNKGKHSISKNESNTNEGALTADIQQCRVKGHQYAGDKESIGQDLDVYGRAIGEEALGPNHQKRDQHFNANANSVIS